MLLSIFVWILEQTLIFIQWAVFADVSYLNWLQRPENYSIFLFLLWLPKASRSNRGLWFRELRQQLHQKWRDGIGLAALTSGSRKRKATPESIEILSSKRYCHHLKPSESNLEDDESKEGDYPGISTNSQCQTSSMLTPDLLNIDHGGDDSIDVEFVDLMTDVAGSVRDNSKLFQNLHWISNLSSKLYLRVFPSEEILY